MALQPLLSSHLFQHDKCLSRDAHIKLVLIPLIIPAAELTDSGTEG